MGVTYLLNFVIYFIFVSSVILLKLCSNSRIDFCVYCHIVIYFIPTHLTNFVYIAALLMTSFQLTIPFLYQLPFHYLHHPSPLIDFCVYHLITIFIPTHRYFFLTLLHFILILIIILLFFIIILSHFYCYYNFLSRPRRPQHIERRPQHIERLTSQVTSLGEQSRRQSELHETAVKRGRQCEAEVHALTTRGREAAGGQCTDGGGVEGACGYREGGGGGGGTERLGGKEEGRGGGVMLPRHHNTQL